VSSSPDKTVRNKRLKTTLIVAAVFALLDFVYNLFSFGIGSWYMHSVPLVILLAGTVPAFVVARFHEPKPFLIELWRMGLSTIVAAMILTGILEIAGSEARSLVYFYGVGLLLWGIAMALYFSRRGKGRNR
jgi:hypothetical protein